METSNTVTVVRKKVVTNVPMFDDDETGNPQNEWVKICDLLCVDVAPTSTAKIYDLEHDENYSNQDDTYYVEFHFDSAFQEHKPPYDIHSGDYVGCYQNGQRQYYRIVKTIQSQLLPTCCVYQLICNVTTPREQEQILGCGLFTKLNEEDYSNGE